MELNATTLLFIFLTFGSLNCIIALRDDEFNSMRKIPEYDIPEIAYLNKSVDPCQNFYQFTCGNFKNVNPMPEDKNTEIWDHFVIIQNEIHALVKDILETPWSNYDPQSESEAFLKAKAFYKACKDVSYTDKLNLPHLKVFHEFGQWPAIVNGPMQGRFSWNELGHLIAEYGVQFFFTMQVIPNNFDGSENVILLQEDGLSNPSNVYGGFFEQDLDDKMRLLFAAENRDYLIPVHVFFNKIAFKLRDLMGTFKPNHDVSDDIEETIEFMRNISRKGIVEEEVEIIPFNKTMTIRELQAWTLHHFGNDFSLNWSTFFQNTFKYSGAQISPNMTVMAGSSKNIYGILNLIRETDDRVLYNFIFARLFTYMAPDTDSYMRAAFNTFYETLGWPVYDREQYCIRKLLGYRGNIHLSYAVTYQYQKYHFNINKLNQAEQLMSDIHKSFVAVLTSNTWMDAESKGRAVAKADNMLALLGFPDDAATAANVNKYYRNLRVCTWDHSGNAKRLRAFRMAMNYKGMATGRERDIWTLSPMEVNALYNRPNNKILLPISMLNEVFFGGKISALDYGRLGSTIGHEITHGFDDSGRLYDENGDMSNWWSTETAEAFNLRTQCYKDQYAQYYIEEIDRHVDAEKTLNENIADNGGLREAYRAFKMAQKRGFAKDIKPIGEFTAEQLFFIGYGTMWCMQETDYYLREMQANSGYAPGRYRVIGAISNMDEFAEAFRCAPNAPMNPTAKCSLW